VQGYIHDVHRIVPDPGDSLKNTGTKVSNFYQWTFSSKHSSNHTVKSTSSTKLCTDSNLLQEYIHSNKHQGFMFIFTEIYLTSFYVNYTLPQQLLALPKHLPR